MRTPPTIVITGATSGLGRLAAIALAKQGVRLGITARSQHRADATRTEIQLAAPGTVVDIFLADFARMEDVGKVGADIARHDHRIDALINNAGLHAFRQRIPPDGYPEMVAVNYFAPWLLTRTLLPTLIRSDAARVVNVASEASRRHGTLRLSPDPPHTSSLPV